MAQRNYRIPKRARTEQSDQLGGSVLDAAANAIDDVFESLELAESIAPKSDRSMMVKSTSIAVATVNTAASSPYNGTSSAIRYRIQRVSSEASSAAASPIRTVTTPDINVAGHRSQLPASSSYTHDRKEQELDDAIQRMCTSSHYRQYLERHCRSESARPRPFTFPAVLQTWTTAARASAGGKSSTAPPTSACTAERYVAAGEAKTFEEALHTRYQLQCGHGCLDMQDRVQWRRSMKNIDYMALRQRQNLQWANSVVTEGRRLFQRGQKPEAFKKYQFALEISDKCVAALVARGDGYYEHRRYEEAQTEYRRALQMGATEEHVQSRYNSLRKGSQSSQASRRNAPPSTALPVTAMLHRQTANDMGPSIATATTSTGLDSTKYALAPSVARTVAPQEDFILPDETELLAGIIDSDQLSTRAERVKDQAPSTASHASSEALTNTETPHIDRCLSSSSTSSKRHDHRRDRKHTHRTSRQEHKHRRHHRDYGPSLAAEHPY